MPTQERIRESIRQMLEPGRRLDAGRVWQVVEVVDGQPRKLAELIECLWDKNLAVANRAADALERVTRDRPAGAQRRKRRIAEADGRSRREKAVLEPGSRCSAAPVND